MVAPQPSSFATTRWSVVLAAGRNASPAADAALAELCQRYWFPLYLYVRRRVGKEDEARDLTQAFFARLLEKKALAQADPERGRFRSFLLGALKHFMSNEADKARAQKRGSAVAPLALDFDSHHAAVTMEPMHSWTAERLYERQWALTLLDCVLGQLRSEYTQADKLSLFEGLKGALAAESAASSYRNLADALGMTEGAVKTAVHRLRRRYRTLLRDEVTQTLAEGEDVDQEIRDLFEALSL